MRGQAKIMIEEERKRVGERRERVREWEETSKWEKGLRVVKGEGGKGESKGNDRRREERDRKEWKRLNEVREIQTDRRKGIEYMREERKKERGEWMKNEKGEERVNEREEKDRDRERK
jgi:hypothetical protein